MGSTILLLFCRGGGEARKHASLRAAIATEYKLRQSGLADGQATVFWGTSTVAGRIKFGVLQG
jgi:hypothetical protein